VPERSVRRSGGLVVVATLGWLAVIAGLAALFGGIDVAPGDTAGSPTPSPPVGSPSVSAPSDSPIVTATDILPAVEVLVGAGDIASCLLDTDEATASLLDDLPGTVFTAGDNAYEDGTPTDFDDCYDPTWGRHRDRTRPAAGNHDWVTRDAAGYLGYFGAAATNAEGRTWYSYELGWWHVIVLDSDCVEVDGCGPDSAQGAWLAADLAANDARCTLAIWHHPRFSSGMHGNDPITDPFWRALHAAGADAVVNGHDHDYERFAPQDPDGAAAPTGLREFVVGTGGAELRPFERSVANSVVRSSVAHGVLELTLQQSGYGWRFISIDGSFTDQGSATCH
jgi:hypothetical protein